jgi:histone deacetylase 11
METSLYLDITPEQWPVVYRPEYNVRFLGLEKIHPFDAGKWGNIFKLLKTAGLVDESRIAVPNEATKEDLLVVHTKKYLKSLNVLIFICMFFFTERGMLQCSFNVAAIAEVPPLCLVPNYLVQRGYLRPMRYQTGGSILAGKLALERGWAINVGGGFHHCSGSKGGGFCVYADITLLIHFVFNHHPRTVQNVMIVDLDAHQGNGYQRDFKDNPNVYIIDVYNKGIYPFDGRAKDYINRKVELRHFTEDGEYLDEVAKNFDEALREFSPQLIVYNAGTDILKGDPLGCLSVSPQVRRLEIY